ncbi:MAG: 3-phosphoglycerate dehydrogenase [Proteobacteria bacterium]|nr:MAG: 3-phosphoglycerate dehydrogenase [Pseudomonadota bacterium]
MKHTKYNIQVFNNISDRGLSRLPSESYVVAENHDDPDVILLRSHKLLDFTPGPSLKAVGRAGAGVNNIPVTKLSERGIPVFNTPGANANAVKELVVGGLLLACRNLTDAWRYTCELNGSNEEIARQVEAGKKRFAGTELPGKAIGIVGLGAIGRSVAEVCLQLGMEVIGYDPMLTVEGAWSLSSRVRRARSLGELLATSDYVSFHVPLSDNTRDMLNENSIAALKRGSTVLNFARSEIVDSSAVVRALNRGHAARFVTDFPTPELIAHEKVITLPHLGASTREAEENCAVMIADQIRDYLENGNIRNSVNYPEVIMPRGSPYRLVVANSNVPNMLGQISTTMAEAGLNIHDMINQSRGPLAYTVVDTDSVIPQSVVDRLTAIEGVLTARRI